MATKVRKQIYIEPEQEERLKRLSAAMGVAEAEIIRQALDRELGALGRRTRDLGVWEAELEFIQELMSRGVVEGGRTWRRDDLYDR